MNALTATDLLKLPMLNVIDPLDYEQILAQIKQTVIDYHPDSAPSLQLESTPESKLVEALAYYVLMERAHANQMALSLSLPHASGPELDNLGALPFLRTIRKVIVPADETTNPPSAAIMESDDEYRNRIRLALEGFSTAGSRGSYAYHCLAAHPDIRDVAINRPVFELVVPKPAGLLANQQAFIVHDDDGLTDPMPGDVSITLLSRRGDGTVNQAELDAVAKALDPDDIVPLTDRPRLRGAQIRRYRVRAKLYFYPGPTESWPLESARAVLARHVEQMHQIGYDITISGLHQALHQPGVQRVELLEPLNDIVVDNRSAAYCTDIEVKSAGVAV